MAAERELEEQLKEAGNKLLVPSSSIDELLSLLDHVEYLLSRVEQSPAKSMQDALAPLTESLAAAELLGHSNVDVKVAVASCISEITRITAPDAPYDDAKMKEVFQLIVSSFEHLPDESSRSYNKRVLILETVAKVRSCVVMLDLECDRLIAEMFKLFLGTIRDYHSENIFLSMETIMTLVLVESEDVSREILAPLLASLKKDNQGVLSVAVKLAEKVFRNCAVKLKPYLSQAIKSLDATINDYRGIIASVCRGDSSVNRHDGNPSSEHVVTEDNSAVPSIDGTNETQVADDLKNASKEDVAYPEVKLTSSAVLTNGVDSMESKKDTTSGKGAPLANSDEQVSNDQPSADKVVSKLEADKLEAEKPSRMDSKNTAKKKGRKSNTSTTILEPSDDTLVANEKDAEGCPDQETGKDGRVQGLRDSAKEDKSEGDTLPMEDAAVNLPSSKPIEAEAVCVTSPSQAEQSRPKKYGQTMKKKECSGREGILRNGTEAKDSGTKANKVERASADFVNEDKISADEQSSKSGGGGRSDSGIKVGLETENKEEEEEEEDNNVEDITSSEKKKGTKKRGRGKAVSESEKRKSYPKHDAKMINSEKSTEKSVKAEAFQDETLVANSKRKPGDDKEWSKASGSINYDESLVGRKVKVWWPKDQVFYDGIIKSFDSSKRKHTVLYTDGEIEVLNLTKERYKLIEDSVSSEEQVSEPEGPDGAEMQRRKKAKTAPASSAKRTPISPKGGSLSSGKSKSGVTKSNRKLKDEGNDSKQKEKTSKPVSKSEDNVGGKSTAMKSKENDGTPSKNKSKQESLKSAEKFKHDSPKTVTQSKGSMAPVGAGVSTRIAEVAASKWARRPRAEPVLAEVIPPVEEVTGAEQTAKISEDQADAILPDYVEPVYAAPELPQLEKLGEAASQSIPKIPAFSKPKPSADTVVEPTLQPRRRCRDEGSSGAKEVAPSSRGPKTLRFGLGEFAETDSAVDHAIARRVNDLSVVPADRRVAKAMDWDMLYNCLHSNMALFRTQQLEFMARTDELRGVFKAENQKWKELAQLNAVLVKEVAALKSENSSLKLENSSLRDGKDAADILLATSNSKVDDLHGKVADLELSSTRALSQVESLQRELEDEKKSKESLKQQLANLRGVHQ